MSPGSSCGSLRGSSSTTSTTPRVRLLRHIARLVADYFASTARPGASARRAACRVIHRRLLHLRRASGCLGMSCGSSCGSLSTTSTMPCVRLLRHVARHVARLVTPLVADYFALRRLVVDYFAYAARPGASAHRAARLAARCQLLHLRRVDVLTRQTYPGGTRGSRLCGEDCDRETENSKVCAMTRNTRFIQVRAARVANPTSCLGIKYGALRLVLGCSGARLGTRPYFI
jgi:hypothetical protein